MESPQQLHTADQRWEPWKWLRQVNSPAGVSLTRVVVLSQCSQEDFPGEVGSWSLGPAGAEWGLQRLQELPGSGRGFI